MSERRIAELESQVELLGRKVAEADLVIRTLLEIAEPLIAASVLVKAGGTIRVTPPTAEVPKLKD